MERRFGCRWRDRAVEAAAHVEHAEAAVEAERRRGGVAVQRVPEEERLVVLALHAPTEAGLSHQPALVLLGHHSICEQRESAVSIRVAAARPAQVQAAAAGYT